jgi:hypothetical protein
VRKKKINEKNPQITQVNNRPETENLAISSNRSLKDQMDWFVEIEDIIGAKRRYNKDDISTKLRTGILDGKHKKDSTVVIYSKSKNEKWNETTSALLEFARGHFILRVLYQPIWGYAMAGFKWGSLIGIAAKLIDTLFFLGLVNPVFAILFLLAIGVCVIPRIGIVVVIAVSMIMLNFTDTNINFFLIVLSSSITGAILGCLPGMTIGGIIGMYLSRRGAFLRAHDASPEPNGMFFKAIILPFIGGLALLIFYFVTFNPWIVGVLR